MRIAALVIIACTVGCAANKPAPPVVVGNTDSIAKAQVYVNEAASNVLAAKPFTVPPGSDRLDIASNNLVSANLQLFHAHDVIDWYDKDWHRLDKLNTQKDSRLAAYHDQWIGDRTWRLWYWIVGIAIGASVAGVLLSVFGGPFAWIGSTLIHIMPWSKLLVSGRDRIAFACAPTK